MKPRVYISGPVTLGDTHGHVREACLIWRQLWDLGFHPVCPHWSAIQAMVAPITYDEWIAYDLEMIPNMDAVLRFGGESKGADRECAEATRNLVPVFFNIADLIDYMKEMRWI